jgi:hypothetical protein
MSRYSRSMNATNTMRQVVRVSLVDEVHGPDAWGTEEGARVFADLNVRLLGLSEGTLVTINYRGLKRSDASFQREAVVETIRKHRPRLLFVAAELNDADVRANLELALEKRGEALVVRDAHDSVVIGRSLGQEEQDAWRAVHDAEELTSAELRQREGTGAGRIKKLRASTASTRLAALWRAGLIGRTEGSAESGGREYRYFPIV